MDVALLVIRVVVGTLLVAHGLHKLAGWFGGYGLRGTASYLEGLGFRPGRLWAVVAGAAEAGAGLLFGLGLLTPLAAGALAATMVVAIRTDHAGKGPWYFNGGWEYNVVLGSVALSFAFGGPGQASIDAALGWHLFGTVWGLATIGVTAVSAMLTLAVRRTQPAGISLERVA